MMNDEESDAVSASILDDDEEEIFEVNHDKPILPLRQSGKRPTQWTWCGKFLKSVGLSAAFLALGLCLAVPGVTLLDLKERVGTTIEYISYIFTARSIGYLLGSILGGFLFDHFDQQLQLSYTLLLTSVATITAPWCTSLIVLAVMISFQGIAMGVLDTGGNVFCMRIWAQQSGPYIQAMHFAFGIGAFIAPLLAKPFLAPVTTNNITPIITHPHLQVHIPGMGGKQHMLYLRDIEQPLTWNQTAGGIGTTPEYFGDGNSSSILAAAGNGSRTRYSLVATFTSTSPRPKKPNSADGKFLKKNFADGQHIKDYLKHSKESAEKNKKVAENQPSVIMTSTPSLSLTTDILAASRNSSAARVTATPTSYLTVDSPSGTSADTKNSTTTTTTTATTTTATTTTTAAASTTENKTVVSTSTGPTLASLLQLRTVTNYVMKQNIINPAAAATATVNTTTSSNHNTTTSSNHNSSSSSNNSGITSVSTGGNSYSLPGNQSVSTENPALTTFHPQKPETFDKMLNNAIHAVKGMSHIQFAYMIIGVLLFLISIFFMCLYCYDKSYQSPVPIRCDRKHKSCFEDQGFRIQILIALFLFFFMYVGMEVTFGGFIMIFAIEQFHWSKDNGVILTSLFWGALAAGRGMSIFITRCCVPCWMLVTNIILVLLASLILSFGLSHYEPLLCVGTLIFGLGLSSMFPTGMSWAESYMTMTGKATAVLIVGSALGEMVIPAITGFFFAKKDKMVLMYIMFSFSLLSCLCFIIMQNLASNQHRKSTRSELSSSLEQQQQQVSLMNGSPSNLSLSCNGDLTCRKHVTFKLDHDRVKYDRLHSSDEE